MGGTAPAGDDATTTSLADRPMPSAGPSTVSGSQQRRDLGGEAMPLFPPGTGRRNHRGNHCGDPRALLIVPVEGDEVGIDGRPRQPGRGELVIDGRGVPPESGRSGRPSDRAKGSRLCHTCFRRSRSTVMARSVTLSGHSLRARRRHPARHVHLWAAAHFEVHADIPSRIARNASADRRRRGRSRRGTADHRCC